MLKHFAAVSSALPRCSPRSRRRPPRSAWRSSSATPPTRTSRLCGILATTLPTSPPSCAGSASTWLRGSIFGSATWKSGSGLSPKQLNGADVGLFYYAGHGLQVDQKNYLAPVDAELEAETDLDFEAVELDLVLKQMLRSAGTSLVFLDACRDNPLVQKLAQSGRSLNIGRGLARGRARLQHDDRLLGRIRQSGLGRDRPQQSLHRSPAPPYRRGRREHQRHDDRGTQRRAEGNRQPAAAD